MRDLQNPCYQKNKNQVVKLLLPENAYNLSGSVQAIYIENHAEEKVELCAGRDGLFYFFKRLFHYEKDDKKTKNKLIVFKKNNFLKEIVLKNSGFKNDRF